MSFAPLISVIIPVYNTQCYLAQCLDSILQQTYPHLEIILLDDASTDDSQLICEKYARKDSRIKNFRFNQNTGVSIRNYGIDKASGKYISFVDSDDFLDKNTYQTAVSLLEQYPQADAVRWGIQSILPSQTVKDWHNLRFKQGLLQQADIRCLLTQILKAEEAHNICLFLLSASLVREHKMRFPVNLRHGEDLYFTTRYLLHSTCIYSITALKLYNYVQHKSSVSHHHTLQDIQWYTNNIKEMKNMLRQEQASQELLEAFNSKFKKINFAVLHRLVSLRLPFAQAEEILGRFLLQPEVQQMLPASRQTPDCWYKNLLFWLVWHKHTRLALAMMKFFILIRRMLGDKI